MCLQAEAGTAGVRAEAQYKVKLPSHASCGLNVAGEPRMVDLGGTPGLFFVDGLESRVLLHVR